MRICGYCEGHARVFAASNELDAVFKKAAYAFQAEAAPWEQDWVRGTSGEGALPQQARALFHLLRF